MEGLQVSGILNLRIIEDADDISSCSIALPELLGDKSGRLFEVVGDKHGRLLGSIVLKDCTAMCVVGVEAFFSIHLFKHKPACHMSSICIWKPSVQYLAVPCARESMR